MNRNKKRNKDKKEKKLTGQRAQISKYQSIRTREYAQTTIKRKNEKKEGM